MKNLIQTFKSEELENRLEFVKWGKDVGIKVTDDNIPIVSECPCDF